MSDKSLHLSSYRSILKGTALFGGVQMLNIVVNLIRGKFVAVILGPEGMGVSSLFNSASNTIQRFSSLGLNLAVVKEVAPQDDSSSSRAEIVATSKRLFNLSALLGALICACFCIPLSRLTFGSPDYAWQFILLGVVVAFAISGAGKLSLLQGLGEVKRISKASVVGSLTGLCIGIPLYWIWGDKGIVPAMLAISLSLWIFYYLSLNKLRLPRLEKINWRDQWPLIKKLVLLGIVLMANDLAVSIVGYLINLFVRSVGSVDDVGLYQAANSVTSQYSGLVFAAMAMDYFPRLSRAASDNVLMKDTVNRQAEITSLLIAPAMTLLILSAPLLIRILLADDFIRILPLMRWMGLGILLRALSFPMAYISFAKGNKKLFFWLECVFCNILTLCLSCIFFNFFGLIGLGYALVVDNAFCLLVYYVINRKYYGYNFSIQSFLYTVAAILITLLCFGSSFFSSEALAYSFMGVTTAFSITLSFLILKRKLQHRTSEEINS